MCVDERCWVGMVLDWRGWKLCRWKVLRCFLMGGVGMCVDRRCWLGWF